MEELIGKYVRKLVAAGYAQEGAPLMGARDADLIWNREEPERSVFEEVFASLDIQSLLFCRPAEPYRTVVDFLAGEADGAIFPADTQTRTFFHDLPVTPLLDPRKIVATLRERKCVIIPGRGIVTSGTVSPEQAFVAFCSVCFAAFVKFFADYLTEVRRGRADPRRQAAFRQAVENIDPPVKTRQQLREGPFDGTEAILGAMEEAGRATVACRLADSHSGNISLLSGKVLYISRTGSSLDSLEGCIDAVPLDGSSCAGITATGEFPAHRQIVLYTGRHTVLHGHPRFSVILSLDCDRRSCPERGFCHLRCPEKRSAAGVPIVPGETGAGRYGLCRTVPPVLQENPGVIVHGHGVFTAGGQDFNEAFGALFAIENGCRKEYFSRVGGQ